METPPDRTGPKNSPETEGSSAPEVNIKRIQIINICILALACLVSLKVSREFAVGVAVGGILMAANFVVITAVIRSLCMKGEESLLQAGLYWVKFAALLVLVGVLILVFRVDAIGFLLGLSTLLVAITVEAVLRLAGR